jgi:hypothetical protein
LFLFKLHAPRNVIVGGGIFAYANSLPCSLAWEAFREANGARSAQEMRARIARYRRADPGDRSDFEVGRFEVSRRIQEEFDNGKHYYALHGRTIDTPTDVGLRPDPEALTWHNEHCFRG